MWPGSDLELNSQMEDINDPDILGRDVLEHGENCGGYDCGWETIPIEQDHLCNGNEDVEVNITACKSSSKAVIVQDFFEDLTESSSSFGDTGSGSENDVVDSFGDQEVESQMWADFASSSMCDDWYEPVRPCDDWYEPVRRKRRKTTDHWRQFISPIMSRCKWIELQLRQLQSLAHKYEQEIAALDYTKELDYAHLTLDGSDIKSVPISGRMRRNKVMKRKKRERVEEKRDLASYMFDHTLFSYYEKKANHNVDVGLEDCQEIAVDGDDMQNMAEFKSSAELWHPVNYYDNDKSWDNIIEEIIAMQSQIQNLKSRYGKVISENSGRFRSINQLSTLEPSDGLDRSDLKPASCAGVDGIVPLNEAADRHELDGPRDNNKDEDLTECQVAREELYELEKAGNQLVKKIETIEENVAISEFQAKEDLYAVHYTFRPCSTLKSNIPWNKGKGKKSGSRRKRISG